MGIFFRDPLLGRLEDYAFMLAKERYITKGVPLGNDVEAWSAETKKAVRAIRDEVFGVQKAEVKQLRKAVGSDFKRVVKNAVSEAVAGAFYDSKPAWYSEERSYSPKILAVPVPVIRDLVRSKLPVHLRKPNQFRNPSAEVIEAIADDAMDRYFESTIKDAVDSYDTFTLSYEDYALLELIPDDFYLVDTNKRVKRIPMLILVRIDSPSDKARAKKSKKESRKLWRKEIRPKQRSNDRVFDTTPWQLSSAQVAELCKRDA